MKESLRWITGSKIGTFADYGICRVIDDDRSVRGKRTWSTLFVKGFIRLVVVLTSETIFARGDLQVACT